jgi:hypothetical protein
VWHRAEVVDSPSFHITFAVGGVTGLDLVKDMIEDLSRQPIFRKYLPRVSGGQALTDHEERLKSNLHDCVDRLCTRAYLAGADLLRRNRSRAILWGRINLDRATKLWIASRRLLPPELLEQCNGGSVRIAGGSHQFGPTELLILRIAFQRVALGFDELMVELRAAGSTASDAELSSAVIRLVEHGVLNAEHH